MSAMAQSETFSIVPNRASSIPPTGPTSRTVTRRTPASTHVAHHQKRTPTPVPFPTSGADTPCNYAFCEFLFPTSGQTLKAGQTYNVSYVLPSAKDGDQSTLEPIAITTGNDSTSRDQNLIAIAMPGVDLYYGQDSFDNGGKYAASWTVLDNCGSVQKFTWTVPTNLDELPPSANGVDYQLFCSYDAASFNPGVHHLGIYSQKFTIAPVGGASTPTPKPKSSGSDGNSGSFNPEDGGGGTGLSGGAKAGIAVGSVVAAALLAWVVWKRYKVWAARVPLPWNRSELDKGEPKPGLQSPPPVEIYTPPPVWEADGGAIISEVDGTSSYQHTGSNSGGPGNRW